MLEIFGTVIFIYVLYYIVTVRKFDKAGNVKKKKGTKDEDIELATYMALPAEAKYFIKKYNIDLSKVNKKGLLKLIAFVLGLDIAAITIVVALLINDTMLQLSIGSICLIPLFLLSMYSLGKYFKKKGLVKDEGKKHTGNRK